MGKEKGIEYIKLKPDEDLLLNALNEIYDIELYFNISELIDTLSNRMQSFSKLIKKPSKKSSFYILSEYKFLIELLQKVKEMI
jgi:hypothetical protein